MISAAISGVELGFGGVGLDVGVQVGGSWTASSATVCCAEPGESAWIGTLVEHADVRISRLTIKIRLMDGLPLPL